MSRHPLQGKSSRSLSLGLAKFLLAGLTATGPSACKTTPASSKSLEPAASSEFLTNAVPFDCDRLEYGLYWFGQGQAAQKFVVGQPNKFYDPKKPTMVYVHGWSPGVYDLRYRETFQMLDSATSAPPFVSDLWLSAGWNVGVFYWHQFADEPIVQFAESKIYGWQGDAPLTWKTCDGNESTAGAPSKGLDSVFYKHYTEALSGYEGNDIRLVGHSLGTQLATQLLGQLIDAIAHGEVSARLLPSRLAVIDPFWSTGTPSHPYPGAVGRQAITKGIASGVAVEMYKDSKLLVNLSYLYAGDTNLPLTALIGESRQDLAFVKVDNPLLMESTKHKLAPKLYFRSLVEPVPVGCAPECNVKARSAASSNDDIRKAMLEHIVWQQTKGMDTATAEDDAYTKQ